LSHGSATHSSSALRSKKRGKVGTGRIIGGWQRQGVRYALLGRRTFYNERRRAEVPGEELCRQTKLVVFHQVSHDAGVRVIQLIESLQYFFDLIRHVKLQPLLMECFSPKKCDSCCYARYVG